MSQPQRLDLTDQNFRANPYPVYARLRSEESVHRVELDGRDMWLVTRYEDVEAVLKDKPPRQGLPKRPQRGGTRTTPPAPEELIWTLGH